MDVWFTSDLHLGHGSILDFQSRPFPDIEETNNALIASVNRSAKAGDILYILGDVAYRNAGGFPAAAEMVAGLRCKKKRLVLGNHDATYANRWGRSGLFESVSRFEELAARGFGYEADMTLCHYPLLQWNRSRHNSKEGSMPSIMVHDHVHGSREGNERNAAEGVLRYDCGVDANGYAPVHIAEIIEFLRRGGV